MWPAVAQTVRWDDGFLETLELGALLLPFVGVPTLLIAVFAAPVHHRVHPVRFRVLLGIPLVLCAWPLLFVSASEPLAYQVMAQIAFAVLIPAPLFPEDWAGGAGR
ncbi:putative protein OS=Streptomyces griseomycini OX=66895 GN=FHS37_004993 PE=4 SV=1 [Streptomyces griseomycini]